MYSKKDMERILLHTDHYSKCNMFVHAQPETLSRIDEFCIRERNESNVLTFGLGKSFPIYANHEFVKEEASRVINAFGPPATGLHFFAQTAPTLIQYIPNDYLSVGKFIQANYVQSLLHRNNIDYFSTLEPVHKNPPQVLWHFRVQDQEILTEFDGNY